jgi:filamentous hemagglutinin family protein
MRTGSRRARASGALVGLALLLAPPGLPPAQAAPRGEKVVSGTVGIERDGSLTRITASDGAIIEFDALDVLAHETLQFLQPSEAARVLNRVLGPDATRIDGALLANGQVYIVNPAGVFFGGSAVVDVGRLVAGAGRLSDEDFAAGVDRFTALAGAVENRGTIRADAVTLVGQTVANHGSVIAPEGMIAMVAGDQVVFGSLDGHVLIRVDGPARDPDAWAVQNSGLLDAGRGEVHLMAGDVYSLAVNHAGITRGSHVRIAGGEGGLVEVAGTVDAANPDPGETGGTVEILGDRISVDDALIDASGDAGGGDVRIGGDFQGKGELPTARRTRVGPDAEIRADALSEGDGGRVIVWADEATGFSGEIRARGGEGGGDGGFAEVSGKEQLIYRGRVDLRAPAGETGTLLLDPENITVVDGSGGADDALLPDVLADDPPSPGTATLSETALESQDADIQLEATNDVAIEELVTDGTLALSQALTITADADGDGSGSFSMFDGDSDGDGVLDDVPDAIVTGGADVTIAAASLRVGTIDTSGTDGGDAGDIQLNADRSLPNPGGDPILTVTGALRARGGDAVDAGDGGDGGAVVVHADGGALEIGADAGVSIDTQGGKAHASGGSGGDGGAVSLTAIGTPAFSDVDPGDGEGAIPAERADVTVAGDIRAGGGEGCTDADCTGDGGWGAVFAGASSGVFVTTTVGSIALASVDTSGGDGQQGGIAGGIVLQSEGSPPLPDVEPDIDGSVPAERGDIAVGDLTAIGGDGTDFDGGDGGTVDVRANIGGVDIASIDTSGGDGGASGGRAGSVTLDAQGVAATPAAFTRSDADPNETDPVRSGTPAVEVALTVAGDVRAAGGDSAAASGSGASGGAGGAVQAGVGVGSLLQVASIVTSGGDGPAGGSAGIISLLAEGADAVAPVIDPGDGDTLQPVVTAAGTDAVTVRLKATGDLLARGGASTDAEAEFGGLGGSVQVTSVVGSAEFGTPEAPSRIETDGGAGTIEGGSAGTIVLFAEGQEAVADSDPDDAIDDSIAHVPGDVTVHASMSALGGDADLPGGTPGGDASIVVFADDTVRGEVGVDQDLFLQASAIGDSVDPSGRLRIVKGDAADATLTVTADGPVGIDVTEGAFATFELTQRDAGGGVGFAQTGGDVIEIEGLASTIEEIQEEDRIFDVVTPGRSTIVRAVTTADRAWTYRLEDTLTERQPDGGTEAVSAALEIAPGALQLGGSAEISNRGDVLLGAESAQVESGAALALTADADGDGDGSIVAQGAAPHIRTDGDLRLEGIGIGAEQPLTIVERGEAGEAPEVDNTLTVAAAGPVGIAIEDRPAFDVIAVTQRDVDGDVSIAQVGGDSIVGAAPPEGGAFELNADTTGNDVALAFRLEDAGPADGEAPDLVIASATLGGDALLASAGGIRAGDGSPLVATDADLVLEAGGAVGSEDAPIRKQGTGGVAGSAAAGGFFLSNEVAGDLRIAPVTIPASGGDDSVAGISASGPVVLTSDTGPIVFADGIDGPHVTSGRSQTYATAEVQLEGDAILESGRGVSFTSPVTGDASLTVNAAGATQFGGDVEVKSLTTDGAGSTRIATARVTTTGSQSFGDAVALDGDTTFATSEPGSAVTFGSTLDGPGGAVIETPGKVTFGGDVGGRDPIAGLTVHDVADAADIEFGNVAVVRTGSGGIHLNPQGRTVVPDIATIYQGEGSLSFETDGDFEVGHREKLSVAGDLGITAASVRVGDVNALSLTVDADAVRIMPREPGDVRKADGSTVTDEGTSVIANQLVFSSTPVIDPDPAFASEDNGVVTLASQSGAVRTPGPTLSAFDVRLIDAQGTALTAADFVDDQGVVLDFAAAGPAAVDDPATAIPRPMPEPRQLTQPRFGTDTPVAAGARPTLDEVLGFLACADVGGAPASGCLAPVAGGDGEPLARVAPTLATPRARVAAGRYRLLVGPDERSRQLRAAYDRAVDEYRRTRWFGAIEGDAFYAYLASEPQHATALAAVDQLATLFVELQLLDLEPADLQQLRKIVARRFLEGVQPGGLDTAALLDAVDASRIGLPGGA